MTENSVVISITIKVAEEEQKYEEEIGLRELEEGVQKLTKELGRNVIQASIKAIDDRMVMEVPKSWRNAGTEERWVISSVGEVKYKRRIYLDESQRRRKPIDELLGIERYSRVSGRVQEMGCYLASEGTYRRAANQVSWLVKAHVSQSAIQRMVWTVGNRIVDGEEAERQRIFAGGAAVEAGKIEAPVLYGESDGVWVHLQREAQRSAEVRVAILSNGKTAVGRDRYRLENKCSLTAIGLNSEAWQEQVLKTAHQNYCLEKTKLLVTGGDGNQWVRQTFERIDLRQEFVLDYFHLKRAAHRAIQDRSQANELVKTLRTQGFGSAQVELRKKVDQAEGKQKQKLEEFYSYISNNQDGLLDLEHRHITSPVCLGAIEGNVDKLVVHRMKGRGCSWRLPGVRAMLALCRHRERLGQLAFRYLPLAQVEKVAHRRASLEIDYSEVINKPMPVFTGPSQNEPWVISLFRYTHGRGTLSS
jgi:hypothetical protein